MYRAMIIKELRETRAVTIGAVILYGLFLMERRHMLEYPNDTIPFINNAFFSTFIFYAGLMAGSLGAWQTFGESVRKTYPFLLHHPATPNWLIGMKLVVGMGVYLFVTAIPIVICALWAATPGTYASPFEWWMTAPVWVCWFAMITIYLATFLSGIMPGPWYGARFFTNGSIGCRAVSVIGFQCFIRHDMVFGRHPASGGHLDCCANPFCCQHS